MSTLFLICGLPGAGKTTYAKKLEQERPALRLTPDEWIVPLYTHEVHVNQEKLDACRAPVENMQWIVAERALVLGIDVILDWGFWGRSERDDFRARATALGANVKICYLEVSREELMARLSERNSNLPEHTFHVTEAQLDLWSSWFQAPTSDELKWLCNI